MCFGETFDTLDHREQMQLASAAESRFPTHRFTLESNLEGMTWARLTPDGTLPVLPDVTICRIAPSIMVMLEDRHSRRQFRALANIEDAIAFVAAVSDEALFAAAGYAEGSASRH